jgi:SpoVK/Ycf46/Vps4 family AAA+-type ATPase
MFTENFLTCLKARVPCIHVRSLEEGRALAAIVAAVASLVNGSARHLMRWTSASGLWTVKPDGSEEKLRAPCDYVMALAELRNRGNPDAQGVVSDPPPVLVLCDPWGAIEGALRFTRETIQHARDGGKTLVFLGRNWTPPPEIAADVYALDLSLPTQAELEEYLGNLCRQYESGIKATGRSVQIDLASIKPLARACCGLSEAEARTVTSLSLVRNKAINAEAVRAAIREKKQVVEKNGILRYIEPDRTMADVGGLEHVRAWLTGLSANFAPDARAFGLHAPRGMAVIGVPGTGKTLLGKAVASEWGLPCIEANISKAKGSLVGQSEQQVLGVFRTIEAVGPCVVIFDESEKQMSEGSGLNESHDAVRGLLTTWMQEHTCEAFVVMTINSVTRMPSELLRAGRIDRVWAVDLPGVAARREILKIHLRLTGHAEVKAASVEAAAQAGAGRSGSELEQGVQRALGLAYRRDKKLTTEDLVAGVKSVKPLAVTMPEQIKALRDWCQSGRADSAGDSIETSVASAPKGAKVDL